MGLFEAINASKLPAHVKEKLGDNLDAASAQTFGRPSALAQGANLEALKPYM